MTGELPTPALADPRGSWLTLTYATSCLRQLTTPVNFLPSSPLTTPVAEASAGIVCEYIPVLPDNVDVEWFKPLQ